MGSIPTFGTIVCDSAIGLGEMNTTDNAATEIEERELPMILVAEDSYDVASLLEHILTSDGYQVRVAHDGQEALDLYETVRPDLLLLDVMMPRRNGFEVLRELRDSGRLRPEVAVLLLTAKAAEEDVMHGFDLGADDYLTKPFVVGELRARVRALLARKSRR